MNSLLVQLLHVMPSNIVKATNLTALPPIYNQSMLSNDISVISGKSYMSFEFPDKLKFPPGLKSHFGGPSKILHLLIMRPPHIINKEPIMVLIEFWVGWAIKPTFGNSNPFKPLPRAPDVNNETLEFTHTEGEWPCFLFAFSTWQISYCYSITDYSHYFP